MFQLSTRQKVFIRSIQRIILRYEKEVFWEWHRKARTLVAALFAQLSVRPVRQLRRSWRGHYCIHLEHSGVSRLLWHPIAMVRAYKCYSHTTRPVCRERSPFTTPCSSKGCLPTAHPPGWIRTSIGTQPSLSSLSCFDLIKSCSSVHD